MSFASFSSALSFLLWSTFLIAIVLGAVVNKTNFCTMGAVSDMVNIGDYNRFRAWLLAIATAILGVTVLEYLGVIDVTATFPGYRAGQLILAENILGGFLFGIGMTLASGCGNKTLVRIGGGNLKSIMVFIIIALIAYYMTNPFPGTDKTLFSVLFYDWIRPLSVTLSGQQDIGSILSPESPRLPRLIVGLVIGVLLLAYIFKSVDFRSSKDNLISGIVIGLIILSGWLISSNISVNVEDEPYSMSGYFEEWDMLAEDELGKPALGRTLNAQSYTFINPIGQTLGYVKEGLKSNLLTFGLVAVFGVILGSFIWSLINRAFRIEWFLNFKDFITHFIGAVLMGFGGVLALGCTIGQGISGFSTLAVGSILTFIFIVFGSALTMKMQFYKMMYEEEASFFKSLITALVDMKLLPAGMRKLEAV